MWFWPCWWQCWWWCWNLKLKENRMLRSGQVNSSVVRGTWISPRLCGCIQFPVQVPLCWWTCGGALGIWMLALAIVCTTGSHHPTAFLTPAIQENSIDCFGNHCFQLLLGFWLFSGEASIGLMAGEFIQWLSSPPGRGRHLSHLVGMQQPEVGGLRGCDSLNQTELFGTAIPAHFLVTEPVEFPWIS